MNQCVIVVPCYNEAARIGVKNFAQFAEEHGDIRFVMVNDGSTDNTLAVLRRLQESSDRSFEVLNLKRNMGKAEAVRRGLLHALDAGADFAGYWDADLATPLAEIPVFVQALHDDPALELILGSRVRLLGHQVDRQVVRHLLGRVFATAASLVLQLPVYDTQCGAKLFRAGPGVRKLFATPFRTGWVFDVEMLARRCQIRASRGLATAPGVREIPLRDWKDVPGSKVRPADFVRSFFQLALIAWTYRRPVVDRRRHVPTLPSPLGHPGQQSPNGDPERTAPPLRKTA